MYNRNYEYFTMIAKEKNISRAAEKLFVSQPSLSKFLIHLEKEIGAPLFERGKKRLELTPAGTLYLQYIQDAQRLREQFENQLRQLNGSYKEHLSLGITPGFAALISYALLDCFHSQCPQAELDLVEDYGMQIMTMFQHGCLNMVLSMSDALSSEKSSRIRSIPVFPDRILLVVPKPMAESYGLSLSDNSWDNPGCLEKPVFQNCHIITGKSDHILHQKTKRIIDAYHLRPQSVIETFSIDNCLRMADAGYGIAFISQMYIENSPRLNHSAFFFVNSELFDCTRVVYCHADQLTLCQRNLIDVIRTVCSQLSSIPD